MESRETNSLFMSMLDLIPMPIVSSTFSSPVYNLRQTSSSYAVSSRPPSSSSSPSVLRLNMAASARALPGGALEYDAKTKRVTFVPETRSVAQAMDALFGDDMRLAAAQSSSANTSLPNLVDDDSVVVRVLFAGGFCSKSFDPVANGGFATTAAVRSHAAAAAAASSNHPHNAFDQNGEKNSGKTGSSSTKTTAAPKPTTDMERLIAYSSFSSHSPLSRSHEHFAPQLQQQELQQTARTSQLQFTSAPGLTFVGRVVTAGKNVQFTNEWAPEADPMSILPRGFKEGDLVAGLQCSAKYLSTAPLRGTLGSYVIVPACFAIRITSEDIGCALSPPSPRHQHFPSAAAQASSSTSGSVKLGGGGGGGPRHNTAFAASSTVTQQHSSALLLPQQQQQQQQHQHSVLLSVAGSLLPAVLWHCMFRWHVDPKRDESLLFMSMDRPVSASLLTPALGAVLAASKFYAKNQQALAQGAEVVSSRNVDHANEDDDGFMPPAGVVAVVAHSEEDAILLERFEEFVRRQSPLFSLCAETTEKVGGAGAAGSSDDDDDEVDHNKNGLHPHETRAKRNSLFMSRRKVFHVLRWFPGSGVGGREDEDLDIQIESHKFHHVFVCDDDWNDGGQDDQEEDDGDDEDGNREGEDDTRRNNNNNNNYASSTSSSSSSPYHTAGCGRRKHKAARRQHEDDMNEMFVMDRRMRLRDFLRRTLLPSGTVGYLSTAIDQDPSARIGTSILPAVASPKINGRVAVMTASALFTSPAERMRRAVAEVMGLLVSGLIRLPPPGRVIKPDAKSMDLILRQFKQFASEQKSHLQGSSQNSQGAGGGGGHRHHKDRHSRHGQEQQQQQQQDQGFNNATNSANLESRWCSCADRVGTVMGELLERSMALLATTLGPSSSNNSVVFQFPA